MKPAFHDHFSAVAQRYANCRPQYPAALFEYLASVAPKGEMVWDCAAGTGQATVGLARVFGSIVATDASAEQIAQAKSQAGIEYRVATAEQSGLADASVGLVTVAQALHWFDLDHFYAEVRRVLRPGGLLAVWAYGVHRVGEDAIDRLIMDFYSTIVGPYWPPERVLVEQGYRTIPFPFAEISPPVFQMETFWTLDQLMGYFGTWSATQRYITARGESPLGALEESLRAVWGGATRERRITWPLALRLGRVDGSRRDQGGDIFHRDA
ncbi:MAG: class I SAM-dependent methyltransferase [Verrucomicrobiales bacterium]|nr:class I SAM-dependent methyltransferase [Verrucomicrobiales bacterium]